ncbi:MAG: hypothetical protein GJ676_03935 [Rhodobacteraceae bacterium]|nr:hypothetical protein [Paracoccaceae bacterium]
MNPQNSAFQQGHEVSLPQYAHHQVSPIEAPGGLPEDTLVLTQKGEVRVQELQPGDKVITRNTGFVPLRAISSHSEKTRMVRVTAGSLGHTRPEEDMDLPADQTVLVRDWRAKAIYGQNQAAVAVGCLVDDEFVLDLGERSQTLFTLEFDRPCVVYAGGLEVAITPSSPRSRQKAA